MSANSAATAGPTAPVTVAASAAAVAPFGPGNWPATATLTNLTQRERDLYASKLAFLNVVETINLSLPNYVGPGNLGSNGGVRAGRAGQVLQVYNAQYAMTLNRHPFSHVHSFGSTISHYKGQMLELINRNSGLGMAAPGPVVAGQQQHLSLVAPPPQPVQPIQPTPTQLAHIAQLALFVLPAPRTPLPSSRPNSAAMPSQEEEEEDDDDDETKDEDEDDEMEGVDMGGEEDDEGEGADLRLLQFFGFRP